jgi:hypothetical protein
VVAVVEGDSRIQEGEVDIQRADHLVADIHIREGVVADSHNQEEALLLLVRLEEVGTHIQEGEVADSHNQEEVLRLLVDQVVVGCLVGLAVGVVLDFVHRVAGAGFDLRKEEFLRSDSDFDLP